MELVRGKWIYDPDTGKQVPAEQYQRRVRQAREARKLRSHLASPQVMRDIEPFRNIAVDNTEISSRSHKREMMKRHNLIEIGNEKRITKRVKTKRPSVKESMKRTFQELSMV